MLLRTVDELIDPQTEGWDETLIRDICNRIEAQRILQIPISPNLEEDLVVWHKTRSYIFCMFSLLF